MKKLSVFSLLLIFSFGITNAQDTYLVNQHQINFDLPTEVMVAIEAGNPGLKLISPPEDEAISNAKKVVKAEQLLYNKDFKIFYKGKNYFKREAYCKDGNLVYLIEQKKNKVLPRFVYNYIGENYSGWALKQNAIVKIIRNSKRGNDNLNFYYLVLQDGNKKQRIFLDGQGNRINRKPY